MAPYRPSPAAPRKSHHKSPLNKNKLGRRSQSPLLQRRVREHRLLPDSYRYNATNSKGRNLGRAPEASLSPDRRRSRFPSAFIDLEQELRQYSDEEQEEEDSSFFPWEDERTLVADLLQEDVHDNESDSEDVLELVDSLQTAFSMRSKELLGDVADTLVPAVKRVKDAHQRLNERVDHDYGAGILDFNETCVKMERLSISEYDEVQRAFQTSKQRVRALRTDLEDAYTRREQLWTEFERRLDDILNPGLGMLKELPAKMERAIADIEKQSKKIHKPDSGHEQTIKDILTKLM